MEDYIVRATAAEGTVRIFAAVTTKITAKVTEIHEASPVAAAALGRTLTAAALMSQMLKGEKDTLTIQIKGDGPLGGIVAVSDSKASVRGYVYNPQVFIPLNEAGKLDVGGAVGKGYLNVIKDHGMKEPYIGYVDLVSGEIGEDIAYYFTYSEQTPSAVSLGVLVDRDGSVLQSGGFIIQLMPEVTEDTIAYIEGKVAGMPSITQLLSRGESPESIIELILGERGVKFLDKKPCEFKCNCSRGRMERNMLSLGKSEILDIVKEQENAEAQCHFCNSKYFFTRDELLNMIGENNI